MLHLLSQLPTTATHWTLLKTLLSVGDKVIIYEDASKSLIDTQVVVELLKWSHQGVQLAVLSELSGEPVDLTKPTIPINASLLPHLQCIDWSDMVDWVADASGVQSL